MIFFIFFLQAQDYGLAIRTGDFDTTFKLLKPLYVAYALLNKQYYLRAVGTFFLIIAYWKGTTSVHSPFLVAMGLPIMDMLKYNFARFVAEDIEIANRGLSQTTGRRRGQSEVCFYLYLPVL